jgi:hypothetical protein
VLIRYQLGLTSGPDQVYLSGLRDSEWLAKDENQNLSTLNEEN